MPAAYVCVPALPEHALQVALVMMSTFSSCFIFIILTLLSYNMINQVGLHENKDTTDFSVSNIVSV
jgi:hypothetical protein